MKTIKTTRFTLFFCSAILSFGSACGGNEDPTTSAQVSNANTGVTPDGDTEKSLIEGLSDEELGELVDELTERGVCNTISGTLTCGDEMLDLADLRQPGADGADGQDGAAGADGADGAAGADGTDGQDGRDGVDGQDGADGADGADGQDGRGVTIVTTAEGAGANCPYGGTRIDFVLEGEMTPSATTYQCDQPSKCQPGYLLEDISSRCLEAAGAELVGTISEIDNDHLFPVGYLPADVAVGEPCRLLVTYPVGMAPTNNSPSGFGYIKGWDFGAISPVYGLSMSLRDGLFTMARQDTAMLPEHARLGVQVDHNNRGLTFSSAGVVPGQTPESSRLALSADLAASQAGFDLPTRFNSWQTLVGANPMLEATLETFGAAGTGRVVCHVTGAELIW